MGAYPILTRFLRNRRAIDAMKPGPKPYRLGASSLHGIGVFAQRDFQRGQVVGCAGVIDMGSLWQFNGLPTVGIVTRGGHVMAITEGFPFWYLNYSEWPNLIAERDGTLRAIQPITAGTELTLRSFIEAHEAHEGNADAAKSRQ